MALWTVRKTLYKLGVLGQHIGIVLFVVGFSTPFWFYASPGEGSQGLWQYCNGRCHKLQVEEDWFETVRALLCLTLILYLVACVLAVYDNFLTKYDPLTYKPSRRIEITTAAAGLVGLSGMAVYTVMMKMQYHEYGRNYFGGAYAVTAAGSVMALLTAVVLSATGRTLNQSYVRMMTPAGAPVMVTYQSTSRTAPQPPPPGYIVTRSAPAVTPSIYPYIPPPSNTPSYMPKQAPGYTGYPSAPLSDFSSPSGSGYAQSPPAYPGPTHMKHEPYPGPPPYPQPSAPATAGSFSD